jgi:hypothetical protein
MRRSRGQQCSFRGEQGRIVLRRILTIGLGLEVNRTCHLIAVNEAQVLTFFSRNREHGLPLTVGRISRQRAAQSQKDNHPLHVEPLGLSVVKGDAYHHEESEDAAGVQHQHGKR